MISIAQDWLRVEYSGESDAPAKIVVPLIIPAGSYRDVRVRVTPRNGVRLSQSVETGSALQETFNVVRSGSIGGSFFGSMSYGRSRATSTPQFTVSMTPDFQSVIFSLQKLETAEETGLQIAFPIDSYAPDPSATFFARVFLEVNGREVAQREVPQESHPRAARALVIEDPRVRSYLGGERGFPDGPFVKFNTLPGPYTNHDFLSRLADGWDIVHVDCVVQGSQIFAGDNASKFQVAQLGISVDAFFNIVDQGKVHLVVLSACNSVHVVSRFRQTNVDALVA